MRLTKLTHACVRIDHDGFTIVLDPGGLSEPEAADGADAIFITHEHFDHLERQRLASAARNAPGVQLWTCRAVAGMLDGIGIPVRVVGNGDAFDVGGFNIQVYGEHHAITHPDQPPVQNIGFLISGPSAGPSAGPSGGAAAHTVFHPGDAFTVPGTRVETLLTPASAPWLKSPEVIEYVREIAPERSYSVHEGLLNEAGLGLVDSLMAGLAAERGAGAGTGSAATGSAAAGSAAGGSGTAGGAGADIRRLRPGESVDL